MTQQSHMRDEIEAIPQTVARFLREAAPDAAEAGRALRAKNPLVVTTVARGSSDHASTYLKYAIELTLGLPVASIGPSIASIYGVSLKLDRAACLAVSQSGKSPDIVAMTAAARRAGAITIAMTNTPGSPLADAAEHTIGLSAGAELSVAATKTFVNSIVAGLSLVAAWSDNDELEAALAQLPDHLEQAIACDWSMLAAALDGHDRLFVLGRGPGWAIASEAALKFKETCGMQAEAYSSAEVMHGPVSIVTPGYPVLALAARDAALASVRGMAEDLAGKGAAAFVTAEASGQARSLPFVATGHPLTDPLVQVASFYSFVETLARRRGFDPDQPRLLNKVTETI